MLLDLILKGPFEFKVVTIPTNEATRRQAKTHMQTLKDLTPEERIRKECDIRAANIILHGLPNDIYTLLNHKKNSYDIWYRVKELMEETELTKQEIESKLVDKFDRFTSERRDEPVILHELYAYLKKNELDANEVRAMKARFPAPLALIANTYNPPPSYSSYKSRYNLSVPVVAQQQTYISQPSYEPPAIYQQPPAIYQQPHARPTSPDSGFVVPTFLPTDDLIFKEKMLLAQQQEAGIEINVGHQDFLADGLEEVDNATTASAIFMAKLSPAGSINWDEIAFGGNTRDYGSILEEMGQEYDFTPKEGLKNKSHMVETASGKIAASGSASDRVRKSYDGV
ncbi:hypothetical protein Tco_0401892 [Tanacetum coccineum]